MKTLRALYVALSLLTLTPVALADTQPDAPRMEQKEGKGADKKGHCDPNGKHEKRGQGRHPGETQKKEGRPSGELRHKGPRGDKAEQKGERRHHKKEGKQGQFQKGERGHRGEEGGASRI